MWNIEIIYVYKFSNPQNATKSKLFRLKCEKANKTNKVKFCIAY